MNCLLCLFISVFGELLDPRQETLDSHTALGKSTFCLCASVYLCYLLCVFVLLVLTANFIKTEVVSWKYLHNTQLEETPTAV